jgi:putative hydrolase of the HAD superfamily
MPRRASRRLTSAATTIATRSETPAQIQSSVVAASGMREIACTAAMAANGSPRAVLLDALGTLLELLPPAPRLRAALREHAGLEVDEPLAARAIVAEIRYYRAHLDEGGTPAGLADLRERCAEIVRGELGADGVPRAALVAALLAALEFRAFPDAAPALAELRARGVRLVVVSNWDVSLHERLAQTGLAPLLDGAVASAEIGAAKPDPAIFRRALELAGGAEPADVEGARAAGIRPVFIARAGERGPEDVLTIASLAELPALLA